ncbi:MAG TPA: TonB C-terminal domain-containing protein [Longimicrobiales bacterium]
MVGAGGGRRRGRGARPGGAALLASLTVHAVAAAAVVSRALVAPPPLPAFKVYEVKIVSPPPLVAGPPEPVAVNAPKVTKPAPEPEPEPAPAKAKPKPPPKAEPAPDPAATAAVKDAPKEGAQKEKESESAAPPRGAKPDPDAKVGGEGIDIRIEGEEFPFPGYLENIQLQIARYFRWTGRPGLEAEIYFEILADGTITGMRLVRGSGDASFNFEAMAAIEQAGKRAAFGPLPEGFSGDRLPVLFYFRPAR